MGESTPGKRLPLLLITAGLICLLAWTGITVIRLVRTARSLQVNLIELKEHAQNGLSGLSLTETEMLLLSVREDVSELERVGGPILSIAAGFKWLPQVGPLLAAGPELMRLADAGSRTGLQAFNAVKPTIEYFQTRGEDNSADIPAILELLQGGQPDFEKALQSLREVEILIESIDGEGLPPILRSPIERVAEELPLVRSGLTWGLVLPDTMGLSGRRAYLILAQNSDELRASGGFLTGAGLITVQNGRILSVTFEDAYEVDDFQNKPYGQPPQPFKDFMGMDIFLFRDANFWADFPASAEMAMELYTYGKGIALDGVIAIDNQFLETLLSAIGPIYVSSLDQTVTENNILSELRSAWGPTVDQTNWVSQRKAFMGPLADSFRSKIETGLLSVDFLLLARDIQSAIRQGHFQIYIRDPMIAKFLNQAGWDGRQYTPLTQDFLQIIDTNMGFNKVNAVIDRKVRYQVLLSENGQGRAELQIKYIHHGQLSGQICVHSTTYSIDTQYADLFNYCYWNYVRVYAPKGSSLLQGSNHPLPAGQLLSGMAWHGQASVAPPEHVELTTFDNFIVLQPEHSVTATFTYLLPSKITVDEGGIHQYSLLVKKQAGLSQYDLEVILGIPEGTIVIQADPEPTSVNGQVLTFSTVATEDFLVTVDYEQDIHNGDDR